MINARNKTKSHFMADKTWPESRAKSTSGAEPENKAAQNPSQEEPFGRNQSPPLKSVLPTRHRSQIRFREKSDARAVRSWALPGCSRYIDNPGSKTPWE